MSVYYVYVYAEIKPLYQICWYNDSSPEHRSTATAQNVLNLCMCVLQTADIVQHVCGCEDFAILCAVLFSSLF
jgi:hypothetical protein